MFSRRSSKNTMRSADTPISQTTWSYALASGFLNPIVDDTKTCLKLLRMPENCFDQHCSCARLELVKAYNGKFSAALANNSETPGISPTRMEFHPSSSCASEILIRR